MRKVTIQKDLICPFNDCRINNFMDEKDREMTVNCESCEYVWNRNSILVVKEGCVFLDENSKEYKEYEILHTQVEVKYCPECRYELDENGKCHTIFCDLADNDVIGM